MYYIFMTKKLISLIFAIYLYTASIVLLALVFINDMKYKEMFKNALKNLILFREK